MKQSLIALLCLFFYIKSFAQTSSNSYCRSVTLETLKGSYDSKATNFYIKYDNLYMEFDLNSPHTLDEIHSVSNYDENLYNQAKDQAYKLFKNLDSIGILKEGGAGSDFKCEFPYYYTIVNYITTDGQIISYKMYISRGDIEKNINSFNRTDFFSDLKRF